MLTFSFEIDFQMKTESLSREEKSKRKLPALRESLILAHYFIQQIESGKTNRTALGKAFGLSSSRITQITHLSKLSPKIQKGILQNNPRIATYQLRQICQQLVWEKQEEMWDRVRSEQKKQP